jgi:uncharacterized CHY-type Zn-finger protein
MTSFEIKDTEIQEVIQWSRLQGGSKHRQEDIYKALDRVIARGPLTDFAENKHETILVCPYCFAENTFSRYQVCAPCKNCKKGIFRDIKKEAMKQ